MTTVISSPDAQTLLRLVSSLRPREQRRPSDFPFPEVDVSGLNLRCCRPARPSGLYLSISFLLCGLVAAQCGHTLLCVSVLVLLSPGLLQICD